MNEMEKYMYHINDSIKHKAEVMNSFLSILNRHNDEEYSFINLIFNILEDSDPVNIMESESELMKTIMNNTHEELSGGILNTKNSVLRKIAQMAILHDDSKIMCDNEFEQYSNIVYRFKGLEYGTPEHKAVADELDNAFIKWHVNANANAHHPEMFENGLMDMTLFNLMEMIIDWCSAAKCRGFKFKMNTLDLKAKELNIDEFTLDIIKKNIPLILEPQWIE